MSARATVRQAGPVSIVDLSGHITLTDEAGLIVAVAVLMRRV